MPDAPIPPALTADEWARVPRPDVTDFTGRYLGSSTAQESDAGAHAIVAVANAALPDSDPRKLTRDDVAALCLAASTIRAEWGDDDPEARDLRRVATKLAALLPPEPSPRG